MQHENWNISLKLTLKIAMTEFKIEVVLVKFSAIIFFSLFPLCHHTVGFHFSCYVQFKSTIHIGT